MSAAENREYSIISKMITNAGISTSSKGQETDRDEINHDGYRLVRDYMGNFSSELPEGYFDFVFSISSLEHVPYGKAEHRELHKNICLDIDRVLKPGGMSLHCFDITVSRIKKCWTNDLAPFMAHCFPNESISVSLDNIAKDPQLFTVSEQYFNSVWKQHPAVSWNYEDGKPSSWNIMWRKPLYPSPDDSVFGWHNISKHHVHPDPTRRKISVVTPSFNQAEFLEECIQSIVGQNYPNLEYIVMDAGSTDGSVEIIRRYAHFISYWQSQPDGGQYQAIEEGFWKSSGEIMTWLNSDDKFHPQAFATVASNLLWSPRSRVDHGKTQRVRRERGAILGLRLPSPLEPGKIPSKTVSEPYIQQEGTFWRRSLWEKAGACLETGLKLAGDLELWARFFRHAQLHTVDAMLAGYRSHPTQKTRNFMGQYHAEAELVLDREITLFRNEGEQTLLPAPPLLIPDVDTSSDSNGYLVSAIVSTYKSEKFIRGCLEDLVNQTLFQKGQLEIVIVDSGSPEGENLIVEEFQKNHSHIRYLRTEERETIYEAWNRAINASSGKYLTNANTDDRHKHDALKILAKQLENDPELALVYADQIVTATENETFSSFTPIGYFAWPKFDRAQLIHCSCVGPQPMWRKSLHDELGLFDETLKVAGDYDWWLRISESRKIKHISALLGLYLMNHSGLEIANPGICDAETLALRMSAMKKAGIRLDYDIYASSFLVPSYPGLDEPPLVSVIVPTHNRPELLAKALESLQKQTFRDFEIIVVNDAGVDVAPLVNHFNSKGNIRYINKETNQGLAAARNSGISIARGKYLAYLDDDDIYYPDHLQILTDYLENSDFQVAYTDAYLALQEQKGETYTTVKRDNTYGEDFDADRLLVENYIPVLCVMHARESLSYTGMFDESLSRHEDWDLWIRLSQQFPFAHIQRNCRVYPPKYRSNPE